MFTPTIEAELRALAGWNWHVHTCRSFCAAPEMTPESVLAEADRLGLLGIALVDHHHPGDPVMAPQLAELAAAVAKTPQRAQALVGAELSACGVDRYAEELSEIREIAFRLYAGNHYHIPGWEHPADRSPLGYKEHTLAILRRLIPSGRAHCIAHPFLGSYLSNCLEDPLAMTRLIADDELAELFGLARRHGVAWEISPKRLVKDIAFARRFLSVGFASGADFRLGTDAHCLRDINLRSQVEQLIRELKVHAPETPYP